MANETTTTTLTELVNSEFISDAILEYAADYAVSAGFCRLIDLRGKATSVASFPRWVLDAGADLSQATDVSTNTALETTDVQVTAAEVGLRREVTDDAIEDSILGQALFPFLVQDAGRLLGIMLEDDICALFAGFSTSVGTSGANLSLANMVEAQAQIRINKMRGQLVYVLDDQQASDYQAAQAAATSTTVDSFFTVSPEANSAFLGSFMNAEVWQTGLCDTANTGANVVGACFIRGDRSPMSAAIGMSLSRDVRTELERNASARSTEFVATAKWGVAEIADESGTGIITDA